MTRPVIEPTDEMAEAGWAALPVSAQESGGIDLDDMKAVLAAALALVEPEVLCGAVYIDPRGGDRPPQDPCGKRRGHENGPETDWKRGFHSNGMLKWLVEP